MIRLENVKIRDDIEDDDEYSLLGDLNIFEHVRSMVLIKMT